MTDETRHDSPWSVEELGRDRPGVSKLQETAYEARQDSQYAEEKRKIAQ